MCVRRWVVVSLLFVGVALFGGAATAVALPVEPGPISACSPQWLVQEGIRTGNAQLLRLAWQRYEEAIRLEPKILDGYLMLGRIYFHLSLLGEATRDETMRATALAQQAVAMAPTSADAHHVLGMVLSGQGQLVDAMSSLELAFTLNPTNEYVVVDMAAIHNALHQPQQTIAMLEGKSIKNGWSYYVLAMAWLQQGERGRALLNVLKARRLGFSGYWVDRALASINSATRLRLPIR